MCAEQVCDLLHEAGESYATARGGAYHGIRWCQPSAQGRKTLGAQAVCFIYILRVLK